MAGRRRTGLAWSSRFTQPVGGRYAGFVDAGDGLPDAPWDAGDRVGTLHDALVRSDRLRDLVGIDFSAAGDDELRRFHTAEYVARVRGRSVSGTPLPADGHAVAALAAGAALGLVHAVMEGSVDNGYALVRPAGHHAAPSAGGRSCVYNNGGLAACEFRHLGIERVLVLDVDAHHGNGAQDAFAADPSVLTISIHQAQGDPRGPGGSGFRGLGAGIGTLMNVPLPAGSGGGAYRAVFEHVVWPAVERFEPLAIVLACGFDTSNIDPSARLRLHSEDYGWMTREIVDMAARGASGRLVATHEGGYALPYLGLCFLRVIDELCGLPRTQRDPFLERWGPDFAAAVGVEAAEVIARAADHALDVPTPGQR